jgi:hypothetical protein
MKKIITFVPLVLLLFIFINCKNNRSLTNKNFKSNSENKIPKNIDDNFNLFLELFSKDSVSQISRVKFPFLQKEWIDPETGIVEILLTKKEYGILDFRIPLDASTREFERYSQTIKINNNKITIEVKGIDNGIHSDYFFYKINGKCTLVSCNEQST